MSKFVTLIGLTTRETRLLEKIGKTPLGCLSETDHKEYYRLLRKTMREWKKELVKYKKKREEAK